MEKVSKGMKIALLLTVIVGGYVALFYVHFEVALIISILIGSLLGMVMMAVEMVPPRKVMVVRNKLTGELSARIGLTFVFPFIEEIVKVLDCRPVVEEPISIKALTKEGEEVALGIQRTYWIDALEPEAPKDKFKGEKGRKGKRRAILAATKIPGEEEEVMERIKEVVDNFTKAHLERLVSKVTMDDLEKDVIPAGFALICPRCGRVLRAKEKGSFPSYCGEEKEERKKEKKKKKECDAKWSVKKKELSFPQTLLGLISFGTSI